MNEYEKKQDRNCGMCRSATCQQFKKEVEAGIKSQHECPYTMEDTQIKYRNISGIEYCDFHGNEFDFILKSVGNEISTRKIIRPFRVELIDTLEIKKDDYIIGRPIGAGCPVYHVLNVYKVDYLTGLLFSWVVGPLVSREKSTKDIGGYQMVGFEGIASQINRNPEIGKQAIFLPGFCMLRLNHKGLVNMILDKKEGPLVRIEDIHIPDHQ